MFKSYYFDHICLLLGINCTLCMCIMSVNLSSWENELLQTKVNFGWRDEERKIRNENFIPYEKWNIGRGCIHIRGEKRVCMSENENLNIMHEISSRGFSPINKISKRKTSKVQKKKSTTKKEWNLNFLNSFQS